MPNGTNKRRESQKSDEAANNTMLDPRIITAIRIITVTLPARQIKIMAIMATTKIKTVTKITPVVLVRQRKIMAIMVKATMNR